MEFGEKFKIILKEKKVTQSKFAQDCNLHEGYVSRVLNGGSPSADFIMKAVGYFPDVDLNLLFFNKLEDDGANEPNAIYNDSENAIGIIDEIEEKLKRLKNLVAQK